MQAELQDWHVVAGDDEREKSHRPPRPLPATRRHAGHITCPLRHHRSQPYLTTLPSPWCPASLGAVLIWLNGAFGAGKTTLAEELHRRLPDAVVYNPEDVGLMLWKWMRPDGDFQHLPSWRELVVATALSLRRHHAETLIVPMSLIRDAYRAEILGGLADAGEEVLHVFLEVDVGVLRERLNARVTHSGRDWDQAAHEFGMTGLDEMAAAVTR